MSEISYKCPKCGHLVLTKRKYMHDYNCRQPTNADNLRNYHIATRHMKEAEGLSDYGDSVSPEKRLMGTDEI